MHSGWSGISARGRLIRQPVVAFVVAAALLLPGLASAQVVNSLNPKLDCVWLKTDGWWISVWRYKNPGDERVIPVGGTAPNDNYFTGSAPITQDQGQFTTFLADQTPQSDEFFTVTMPPTVASITWHLSGNSVTADKPSSSRGNTCSSQPVPLTGSLPPLAGYLLAALVMALLSIRQARRLLGRGG